jgi:radical SAM C-methyltransferase
MADYLKSDNSTGQTLPRLVVLPGMHSDAVLSATRAPTASPTGAPRTATLTVALVQQGVWDTPLESMPLAMGYLKAMVIADPQLRNAVDVNLANFRGGEGSAQMAETLLAGRCPDVVAFSVCGWNYHQFGAVAETFRQLNPEGWIVWGGTHVANQANRVFRLFPWVDIVANGEGEHVFCELLKARLHGQSARDLKSIAGISYQAADGKLQTTSAIPRIHNLDSIPSPFLTGALPLRNAEGECPYDVVLMETSRGCPYKCAFCYWGGATGQKIRGFSRERLRAELDLIAQSKIETVVLCDANFGLRPQDEQFLDDLIAVKHQYGYPRTLETSWAKNKSDIFYSIVRKMKAAGLHSSFTLALQTLSERTLEQMQRRNMRLNDWEALVSRLRQDGMDCYAELIWGAPGETPESFLTGYDRLAAQVPRIATYPLLLLPNTQYLENRASHGFITVRGQTDDFEYVLASNTMSIAENSEMQRFLLWARIAAENPTFRMIWPALRAFSTIRQSEILLSLADWFDMCEHPAASGLRASQVKLGDPDAVPRALRALCSRSAVDTLLADWWVSSIVPRLPKQSRAFLTDAFRYDIVTRPIFDGPGVALENLRRVSHDGTDAYAGTPVSFRYLPDQLLAPGRDFASAVPSERPCHVSFHYRRGYASQLANHEMSKLFVGLPVRVARQPSLASTPSWGGAGSLAGDTQHATESPANGH